MEGINVEFLSDKDTELLHQDLLLCIKVIEEFSIKDTYLAVICLKSDTERDDPEHSIIKVTENTLSSNKIGEFELDNRKYFIIQIFKAPEDLDSNLLSLLTEREIQIATLVASGCSNKQAANQLHISEWTVSAHLRRIFIKLGVDSRAAMIYRCAGVINRTNKSHSFFKCTEVDSDNEETQPQQAAGYLEGEY